VSATGYLRDLPFEADPFQLEAAAAIERGETVVVTAPTGAGKTAIAGAAIAYVLAEGKRAVYTTPIKALSNQKFGDLRREYDDASVGLLTGDNSINGSAPIVVMTTEVLRNMMYAESPDLADVGVVVLDEVHYLQDRERGAVWEEIIIHLDRAIPLVCLSATIANAEEFAAWIEARRGPTELVVETERPVPLEVTYLVRDRFSGHDLRLFPVFAGSRPNERVASMLRRDRGRRARYVSPRRHETCELLDHMGLLPAIYFIFSRRGCEAAAQTVVDRGLRLTTRDEADEISRIAEEATAHLDPGDLDVLGYSSWLHLLRTGVAAHHAGMVPAMKETVEQLFALGLVRLVFATETLALGINMPARTVVLESLSKFTGESHETLEPGDFTQLTGRAGRRGIDTAGTAVVLHSEYLEFDRVAGIAARGTHPLRSSFRPTFNMAVNLVARYDQPHAERLLGASFAEFARSRRRESLEDDIATDEARLARLRQEAEHPDVDVFRILDEDGRSHAAVIGEFVRTTAPGDVLEWTERGRTTRVVVVAVGSGKHPRVLGVTDTGDARRFASGRFPSSLALIGRLDLEPPIRPRDAKYRREVADRLGAFRPEDVPIAAYSTTAHLPDDIGPHLEAARAVRRLENRLDARRRRAAAVGPAIVRRFRAILGVLERLGYVGDWTLSSDGERLRTIYNDLDLVLAESLRIGAFADLGPAQMAALASAFTYQPRRAAGAAGWPPSIVDAAESVEECHQRVTSLERAAGLDPSRPLEPGFATVAEAWAEGVPLDRIFADDDAAEVGDFVRNMRQLIDLLRQIDDTGLLDRTIVMDALRRVDRGVVAAAGSL
jgi:ATP-dependent RNA helicase HelY